MKNVRSAIAVVVLLLALVARLAATNISGTWTSVFDSEIGKQEYTYRFMADGRKLTGTIYGSQVGESRIQNGRINGDSISFVETGKYQGYPFRIYYSGTLTSENDIAFTRTVVGLVGATEEIVATRVK